MKFSTIQAKTTVGVIGIAGASIIVAATAAAEPAVQPFGSSERLVDGPLVTSYTVANLRPADVAIPGFNPTGRLYQADVTAQADTGTVTPLVADFNARAANHQTYRVVDTASTPGGISPAPIRQGDQASGKIYFDVTGEPPNGVVYNDGVQDVLIWTAQA